jgi:hypothetical protein
VAQLIPVIRKFRFRVIKRDLPLLESIDAIGKLPSSAPGNDLARYGIERYCLVSSVELSKHSILIGGDQSIRTRPGSFDCRAVDGGQGIFGDMVPADIPDLDMGIFVQGNRFLSEALGYRGDAGVDEVGSLR